MATYTLTAGNVDFPALGQQDTRGDDLILGLAGDDYINAGIGENTVFGGEGSAAISAVGDGDDRLISGTPEPTD